MATTTQYLILCILFVSFVKSSILDSFLSPQTSSYATGGEISSSFPVKSVTDCATSCLSNSSCISFNIGLEQQPPTKTCGIVEECYAPNVTSCPSFLTLSCVGGIFTSVDFASYGLPITNGSCNFSATPTCDASTSRSVFETACLGKSWCSIDAQLSTFGTDPCTGIVKFIAASLSGNCTNAPPPPAQLMCQLNSYSRIYTLKTTSSNVSYYQKIQLRNDSSSSISIPYVLDIPSGGVFFAGTGLLSRAFNTNLEFLVNGSRGSVDDLLFPYRKRYNASSNWPGSIFGWDDFVPGSVASMLLMGAGGALRWTEHETLRSRLIEIVDGIAAVVESDGFAVGYPESDTNAYMNGNNQLPSYVNSWFTHGMLEASFIDERALMIARNQNTWWNNCTYLPQLFPQDSGDDHEGPAPNGYDPSRGMTSSEPFSNGHLLYWMNQAGIGHSRIAVSRAGTQADVDFLQNLFREDWWLDMLAARNKTAIFDRKWYPDNYEVCVLECYLDLYTLTGETHLLDAVKGGWEMFRDPINGWIFPGGSFALNENYLYPPGSYPLEFQGRWGVNSRPTGELCPSSFWIYLNKRFHRLFPLEEVYVAEIERSLINVGMAGQSETGIRYFARLHGVKDPLTSVGTCCEGQSVRVFGAAPEHIFSSSSSGNVISIDLFEASTILVTNEASGGAITNVTVSTSWPFNTRVDVLASATVESSITLNIRIPIWTIPSLGSTNVTILLNGESFTSGLPGTYVVFDSLSLKPSDVLNISFQLVMAPSVVLYTGVTQKATYQRFAYLFGPFLLAAIGTWNSSMDCIIINGVNASSPADWLSFPPDTPPGALPSTGEFGVLGNEDIVFQTYYSIGSGIQFTVFPIVKNS
jgi:hypothetical protein